MRLLTGDIALAVRDPELLKKILKESISKAGRIRSLAKLDPMDREDGQSRSLDTRQSFGA